jgi:hypothetical protein
MGSELPWLCRMFRVPAKVKPLQRIICAVKSKAHVSHIIEEYASKARSEILREKVPVIIAGKLEK